MPKRPHAAGGRYQDKALPREGSARGRRRPRGPERHHPSARDGRPRQGCARPRAKPPRHRALPSEEEGSSSMSEIDVYRPAAEVAVPDAHDTDSWITVVSDILKIANVIYDTPFLPDGLRGSAPAVAAAMLAGREMGDRKSVV